MHRSESGYYINDGECAEHCGTGFYMADDRSCTAFCADGAYRDQDGSCVACPEGTQCITVVSARAKPQQHSTVNPRNELTTPSHPSRNPSLFLSAGEERGDDHGHDTQPRGRGRRPQHGR